MICHGIPDNRELQDGDICNVDVSCYVNGYHGDANETLLIGNVAPEHQKLVQTAYECLELAIASVKPNMLYRDVGNIITQHATKNGCSVVRSFVGHGVGPLYHALPNIPHYASTCSLSDCRTHSTLTRSLLLIRKQGSWYHETGARVHD